MTLSGNTQMMHWNQRRSRLPEGYREVDYLESTGAQWIDTLYVLQENDVISTQYAFLSVSASGDNNFAFGYQYYTSTENSHIFSYISQQRVVRISYLSPSVIIPSYTVGDWINVTELRKEKVIVNGTTYAFTTNGIIQDITCHIFADHYVANNENKIRPSACRFRQFDIVGKRSYIPCVRTADGKPGMYDLCGSVCGLTGTPFYINAGAGVDFLWGEL